ncbi:MAG: class I SAM-dependent methyltransferase [Deltaproteobacteria bacterium]|nr:class I SAM-dependent methyltransferase [Deltaproteobacteria bacterium]
MQEDRVRWNKRYMKNNYSSEPSQIILDYFHLAKVGKALDIGAGTGRNSLFLSQQGFEVDSVDISELALERIEKNNPKIKTFHADLDDFELEENSYELIININFLLRRLYKPIIKALKKDGILIFQTFLDSPHLENTTRTVHKAFYLKSNELLKAFGEFQILFYEEKGILDPVPDQRNLASLVALK